MAHYLKCEQGDLIKDLGYQAIAGHLMSYQKRNTGWDDFVIKVDNILRDVMTNIFQDCRESGFFNPYAIVQKGKKRIYFSQVVDMERKAPLPDKIKPDLCYFCEKHTCNSMNFRGDYVRDMLYCWRKDNFKIERED